MSEPVSPIVNAQRFLLDPDGALQVLNAYLSDPANWTSGISFMGFLAVLGIVGTRFAQYLPGVGGLIGKGLNKVFVGAATRKQQLQAEKASQSINAVFHYADQLQSELEVLAPDRMAKIKEISKDVQDYLGVREDVRVMLSSYRAAHAPKYETATVDATARHDAGRYRQDGLPALEPRTEVENERS